MISPIFIYVLILLELIINIDFLFLLAARCMMDSERWFQSWLRRSVFCGFRPKKEDAQAGGSLSGGTGGKSETSQKGCFPFLLDDEQQGSVYGKLSRPPLFSPLPPSSSFLPFGKKSNAGHSPPTRTGFPVTRFHDNRSRILNSGAEDSAVMGGDHSSTHSGSSTEGRHLELLFAFKYFAYHGSFSLLCFSTFKASDNLIVGA